MRTAVTLLWLLVAGTAGARDATQCVDVYNKRQMQCQGQNGLTFRVRNTCDHPIDFKYCAQRAGGGWDCGEKLNTRPGGATSWETCSATGRYHYWGRVAGTPVEFPAKP